LAKGQWESLVMPLLLLALLAAGGVYWYEKKKTGSPTATLTAVNSGGAITATAYPVVFVFSDGSTIKATLPSSPMELAMEQANPGSSLAMIKQVMAQPGAVMPTRADILAKLKAQNIAVSGHVGQIITGRHTHRHDGNGLATHDDVLVGGPHGGGGHGGGHGGHGGHGHPIQPIYGWGGGWDGGYGGDVNVNIDTATQDPLCASYAYHGNQHPIVVNGIKHHPACPSVSHITSGFVGAIEAHHLINHHAQMARQASQQPTSGRPYGGGRMPTSSIPNFVRNQDWYF
jgi:hypothetical protein